MTRETQGGGVYFYINQLYCNCQRRHLQYRCQTCICIVTPFPFLSNFLNFLLQLFIFTRRPILLLPVKLSLMLCKSSPDAANFIVGDFNHVCLKKTFPSFYQYVSCPTRQDKTIDLCYGSVKEAYKSLPQPRLGSVDHSCVHLLPTDRTVLKREKVQTKNIKDRQRNLCFTCINAMTALTGTCS